MAAISAVASPPSRLAAPIAFEAAFCSAFSDSTSGRSARVRSSSSSTRSSRASEPSRRRASAARTGSGSRRICLRSSIGGYSEPPPPEYSATNSATFWASSPVRMFCGIGCDEKPPLRIA